MIVLLFDAAVLMLLLQAVNEGDASFGTALLLALGTGIVGYILALGLSAVMGDTLATIPAGLLSAALLGVIISAMYGVEIKRAFLIAGLYFFIHICFALLLGVMLSTDDDQQAMRSSPPLGKSHLASVTKG